MKENLKEKRNRMKQNVKERRKKMKKKERRKNGRKIDKIRKRKIRSKILTTIFVCLFWNLIQRVERNGVERVSTK